MIDPQRIWSSPNLPSLPSVAVRLLEISKDPESPISDLVDVIKTDPAISARILASANSALFGLRHEIPTVERAVPLLGRTAVTSLALSFSLVDTTNYAEELRQAYADFWTRSVVQAATSDLLGRNHLKSTGGEYFLAGLLIDLGRLAMLKTLGVKYVPVLEQEVKMPLVQAERERFGFDHAEIGCKLMEKWKMPQIFIDTTRIHHSDIAVVKELSGEPHFAMVKASLMASAVGECLSGPAPDAGLQQVREIGREFFDLEEDDVETFLTAARERAATAAQLLKVNLNELIDPVDLMSNANAQLVELTMREAMNTRELEKRNLTLAKEKEEIESQSRELRQRALTDTLTGVYNRGFFDEVLSKELCRCARQSSPVGVIFADVDNFKKINDTYGHAFGDEVLKRVASVFSRGLRGSDVIARYGGEEFVVLLPGVSEQGIVFVAERIRADVEQEQFRTESGDFIHVTISVGGALAGIASEVPEFATQLLETADKAMYECKHNGRNQSRVTRLKRDGEGWTADDIVAAAGAC